MNRTTQSAPPRTAYSIPEVAKSLGLSTRQGYRLVESGQLPARRIGGRLRVLVEDFEAFRVAS